MKLHLLKASALALLGGAAAAVRAHEDPAQALHDVAKGAARAAVDAVLPPSGAPPPGQGPPRPSESCVRYSKVKCCLMECEDRDDKERCDNYCEKHYGETSEDASEPSAREIEDVAAGAATGNDDLDWCLDDCEEFSRSYIDENVCKARCVRDFDDGNNSPSGRRDWDRSPNSSPSRRRDEDEDDCDDDDLDCCLDECYYNSRSTTDENICQARCVRDFDGGNDSRRRPDDSPNRSPSSPSNRSPTYRRPSSPNGSPSSPNRRPSPNRSPSSPNRRPSPPNRSPSSPNRRPSPPNRSPSSPNRSPNARPAPSSHMDEAAVE